MLVKQKTQTDTWFFQKKVDMSAWQLITILIFLVRERQGCKFICREPTLRIFLIDKNQTPRICSADDILNVDGGFQGRNLVLSRQLVICFCNLKNILLGNKNWNKVCFWTNPRNSEVFPVQLLKQGLFHRRSNAKMFPFMVFRLEHFPVICHGGHVSGAQHGLCKVAKHREISTKGP